jgi:hypothetical protein
MCGWDDGGIEEDGEQFHEHVHVEKEDDFLSPYGRVLAPNVEEHDGGHQESRDVDKAGSWDVFSTSLGEESGTRTWLKDDLAP